MIDTPTLLIGLGGTGGKIAYSAWNRLSDADKAFVGLHIFDTDRNSQTGLGRPEYKPLWDAHMITQTSPAMTVRECFDSLRGRTQVENWFPLNDAVGQKPMTDGAAQVRAVSRLALLDTIVRGDMRQLDSSIEHLLRVRPQQGSSAFRVLVVDTLAGGTGSGIFLPIALYLREYMKAVRGRSDIVVRNLSLMPGLFVNTGVYAGTPEQEQRVLANGFAAIKELDALMVARQEDISVEEKQMAFPIEMEFKPLAKDAQEISTGPAPYETAFLIDHTNAAGQSMQTAEDYVQQAIDCAYLQLLSPLEGRINGMADNVTVAIDKSQGRGRYASMSAGTLRYPYDDIINYLALRWSAYGLDEQWLLVDRQWRKERDLAIIQRKSNPAVAIPPRASRYVAIIDHQAQGDSPNRFAKEVRRSVQEIRKDPRTGVEIASEKVDGWLSAAKGKIASTIDHAGQLQIDTEIDNGALRRKNTFVEQVATGLATIDRLHKKAIATVEGTASMVLNDVLWEDGIAEPHVVVDNDARSKLAYRLNTWLLWQEEGGRKIHGLHPVAIRYFLYRAHAKVQKTLEATNSEISQLREGIEALRTKYDDPKTPHLETAIDAADEVLREAKWYNTQKLLDKFAEKFERDFRAHANQIVQWAASAIEGEVLRRIKGALEAMISDWENFFDVLEDKLIRSLKQEIENEKQRNQSGANDMELPVLGSADDKMRFWKHVSGNFADQDVSPEICARLYIAQYKKAVDRHNQVYPKQAENPEKTVGKEEALFREHVLGWCKAQLYTNENLRLDIVSAIRMEWEIGAREGNTADEWLNTRVNQLVSTTSPWLSLKSDANPQQMFFWGLSPTASQNITNRDWFKNVFEKNGNNAVENSEFSPFEIKRFVASFAIASKDINGFQTGSGAYWKAYQDQLNEELGRPNALSCHSDKRWVSPAFLREMNDEQQSEALANLRKAVLYALIQKDVVAWVADRVPCWRYYEGDRAMLLTDTNGQLCAEDLLGLFIGLAANYRLVNQVVNSAAELEQNQRRRIKAWTDLDCIKQTPAFLLRLLKESGIGGNLDSFGERTIFQLTEELADEILACSLRFHGEQNVNSSTDEATKRVKELAKKVFKGKLSEMGCKIKATFENRPKLWAAKSKTTNKHVK